MRRNNNGFLAHFDEKIQFLRLKSLFALKLTL